jgi:hypothetical protein
MMAKLKRNSLVSGFSGKLGNVVFRQRKDGTTILATPPDFSNRVFSEEQLKTQSRFQQATAYAKVAAKAEPSYAALAQNTPSNAYNLALSDWFHGPVIHEVARYPARLRIDASDNVLVAKVVVTISDEGGQTLEQGEAALVNGAWWEYATTAPDQARILVEAFDLAGNVTRQEA